jgi:hypothetical protein
MMKMHSAHEALLAHQPNLKTVELCRQEEAPQLDFEVWRSLFGLVSKKVRLINVIGTPWMQHEVCCSPSSLTLSSADES